LVFGYTPLDYSGDQVVSRTVVFNGRQYTLGTRIQSALSIQHLQLGWSYDLIRAKEGRIRVGPVVEADGFLMHGRLTAPDLATPITEVEDVSAGLPTAGVALTISPHRRVDIYGQVAGMSAGSYGYFVGSDSGVRVRPVSHLLLTAGYRTFNLHIESSADFFRTQLRGPFVGAGFWF